MTLDAPLRGTAAQLGIQKLYHYERFVPEYLLDVLTNSRLHCADPGRLNDPWDGRPWFDTSKIEDNDFAQRLASFLFGASVSATHRELLESVDFRRKVIQGFTRLFGDQVLQRWRFYCLTPHPNLTLMWSHYAESHRGICLEFDATLLPFASAHAVEYFESYPAHDILEMPEEKRHKILLAKSNDWSYEQEFRIIGLSDNDQLKRPNHPLVLRGPYLEIPRHAITGVIVGCEADVEAISETILKVSPNLQIKQAVRHPDKYRLEIVNLTRSK